MRGLEQAQAGIHAMDPPLYGAAAIGQSDERGSTAIRL